MKDHKGKQDRKIFFKSFFFKFDESSKPTVPKKPINTKHKKHKENYTMAHHNLVFKQINL